ncbi:MAG: hybrid sensor histidine kinase/response regulator [Desulfatibacillaceae bacterium]|nr:hybrid sensor histidine kinase/response regulator [Desulfatibacillaceae bacterium]
MKDGPILIVDDEADIRETLEIFLLDAGYKVLTAENGEKALEIYGQSPTPITIADIKMPAMDGIELLNRIKRINPEAEVIMITGHGDMDLAIKSLKSQATDFITKPIRIEALEVALNRARERIVTRQMLKEYTQNLERLLQEKLELQDHLSQLGVMIGSISHSIKGLLTGLDGGLYMLECAIKEGNTKEVDQNLDVIKGVADKIRRLVLDILLYAKNRSLEWEAVDVAGFVKDLASVVERKIKDTGIRFEWNMGPEVKRAEMDSGLLHSALINIIDNAVDACLKDTKKEHRVSLKVKEEKGFIVFEVADNGIGMDGDTMARLFTLFFSTKGKKGTGFGLFISKKIVEQHGGSISVDSHSGRGSRFSIKLPQILPEEIKHENPETLNGQKV